MSLGTIDQQIEVCQLNISHTYDTAKYACKENALITRQGFHKQLQNLIHKRDAALRNITIIDPRIVRANGSEHLNI